MTNTFNRQELVEAYIDRVLDNMSTKDLLRIVGDQLEENISLYSDEELISEVEEYYPELLEGWYGVPLILVAHYTPQTPAGGATITK